MSFKITDLVGTPYELGVTDCWGLVRLAFERGRGIQLPALNEILRGAQDVPRGFVRNAMLEETARAWYEISLSELLPYDYVSLRMTSPDSHCAIVCEDGRLLTTSGSGLGARLDPLSRWVQLRRVCGAFRYRGEVS